jgi:hypothetical protein
MDTVRVVMRVASYLRKRSLKASEEAETVVAARRAVRLACTHDG